MKPYFSNSFFIQLRQISWMICSLLLISAVKVEAGGDRRLSPPEPKDYSISPELLIQSASSLGDTSLVVWGTSRFAPDSSHVGQLVGQLLVKGDTSIRLSITTEQSRPFGAVLVIAVKDGFLSIWADRRNNDTAVYTRYVSTTGQLGNERRLLSGNIRTGYPWVFSSFGFASNRQILFVIADTNRVIAFDVLPDGQAVNERIAGQKFFGVRSYSWIPDLQLAFIDSVVWQMQVDGTIDSSAKIQSRFGHSFVIQTDSSLHQLQGDLVHHYRHYNDQTPVDSQKISFPPKNIQHQDGW